MACELHPAEIEELPLYWIVDGKTYDFSEFLKIHPGGSSWFLMNKRRDLSNLFWTYHKHPEKLTKILAKYEKDIKDVKPIIDIPPFLLKEGFDASRDVPTFDHQNEKFLLPRLRKELDQPRHRGLINFYNCAWDRLCKVFLVLYVAFSLSMIFEWLHPVITVPAMIALRTSLAAWGHYYIHSKKPNWGDCLFDITYVGTELTAGDGHVMLHHAYTQTPVDVKTSFFYGMLEHRAIWRVPGYTFTKLGNLLFGNLARGLEMRFFDKLHTFEVHPSFWIMRVILMAEFWACWYTGNLYPWFAQFFFTLWINTCLILSSHEFENYGAEEQGKDWGKFQVKSSFDLVVFGNKWVDVLASAGLSSHRVHHVLPYQPSGFANIHCEEPLKKVMNEMGMTWEEPKNFWTDRMPFVMDLILNSPITNAKTRLPKYHRKPGFLPWLMEQLHPLGPFEFAAFVLKGTVGIGNV